MLIPVILAGGKGTRLWPLSREHYPKQFYKLVTDNSLLQDTTLRARKISNASPPLVICNQEHRFLVAEQLREIDIKIQDIILEPCSRNTAPAATIAALYAYSLNKDARILLLPADHYIESPDNFLKAIETALPIADENKLLTFGLAPKEANTGYGYIKRGKPYLPHGESYFVDQFVEKPNQETAEKYLALEEYYWNSGMFLFKAESFLSECEKYQPKIYQACKQALDQASSDLDFIRLNPEAFSTCEDNSIDYAIMEKTSDAMMVPIDINWSDVGTWNALHDVKTHDTNGNSIVGDIITDSTSHSTIHSDHQLVVAVGLQDTTVVSTHDAVLIANNQHLDKIKDIVSTLKKQNRKEILHHRRVYRPWGYYDSIDVGEKDQVKRIHIKPGAKLSLQKHNQRAEHWIIVKGTATVIRDKETLELHANESTYIPIGMVHSIQNRTSDTLELIEVQTGNYLGEDDIIRIDDIYGRTK